MTSSNRIEELLDQWEDYCEADPNASTSKFVSAVCTGNDAHLAEELQLKIEKLRRVQPLVERMEHPSRHFAGAIDGQLPIQIEVGAEPVPGYVLQSRIATGGYGEVWKATAPGDFPVAIKFVRLTGKGIVEQKALRIAKRARHPNLVTTHHAWSLGGYLIVVMELADCSLGDLLQASQEAGTRGIERPKLLRHMADAAAGIDYLNKALGRTTGIQHRDIKPQNLLVVGGRTKVADFGIARIVHGTATGHTGAMTVAYAAPEFFNGKTSSRSDQYSLAVTYCYLLTGKLPFDGSAAEMMNGHLRAKPNVSGLPNSDRDAVSKALAKDPNDRWSSCSAFVSALSTRSPPRQVSTVAHRRKPRRATFISIFVAVVASAAASMAVVWIAKNIQLGSVIIAAIGDHQANRSPIGSKEQERLDEPSGFDDSVLVDEQATTAGAADQPIVEDRAASADQAVAADSISADEPTGVDGLADQSIFKDFPTSFVVFEAIPKEIGSGVEIKMTIDGPAYTKFVSELSQQFAAEAYKSGRALLGIPGSDRFHESILRHDILDKKLDQEILAAITKQDRCVLIVGLRLFKSNWGKQDEYSLRHSQGGNSVIDCDWFTLSDTQALPIQRAYRNASWLKVIVSESNGPRDITYPPISPLVFQNTNDKTLRHPGGPAGMIYHAYSGGGDIRVMSSCDFTAASGRRTNDKPIPQVLERVMVVLPGFFENAKFVNEVMVGSVAGPRSDDVSIKAVVPSN